MGSSLSENAAGVSAGGLIDAAGAVRFPAILGIGAAEASPPRA
jgi:hypothetical protein